MLCLFLKSEWSIFVQMQPNSLSNRLSSFFARYRTEIIVFCGAVLLLLPGIFWGMPSEFPSEIDSPVPMGPIRFFMSYSDTIQGSYYPTLQYIIIGMAYAVCFVFFKLTGIMGHPGKIYPFGLTDPVLAMTILIAVGRFISVLMGAAICAVVFRCVRKMAGVASGLIVILSLISSSVFTYYSRVCNVDIPECFWWVLSFGILWRVMFKGDNPSRRTMIFSGIFAGMACATKDQVMVIVGAQCLLLLFYPGGRPNWARFKNMLFYGVISLGAYVCTEILPQPARWVNHISIVTNFVGIGANLYRSMGSSPGGWIAMVWATLKTFVEAASPLIVLLGLVGSVLLALRRNFAAAFVIIPGFLYIATMIRIGYFPYERFFLNAGILAAFPAGYALGRIRKAVAAKALFPIAAVAVIAAEFAFGYVPQTIAMISDSKSKLVAELERSVPKESKVAVCTGYFSFPNADAYRQFSFCSPDSSRILVASHRISAILPHDTANFDYLLADHNLATAQWEGRWNHEAIDTSDLRLIAVVRHPRWIEKYARVYRAAEAEGSFWVTQKYYLYKREKG